VQLLADRLVVVARIELGAIAAPGGLLDRAVDLTQPLRRHAQRDHLADSHHHVPAHDLDTGRGKRLVEALRAQLRLDLFERLRLIVLEKDGEQERALAGLCCGRRRPGLLGAGAAG